MIALYYPHAQDFQGGFLPVGNTFFLSPTNFPQYKINNLEHSISKNGGFCMFPVRCLHNCVFLRSCFDLVITHKIHQLRISYKKEDSPP